MVEKHGEDAFTYTPHDPQLWMEDGETNGLDRNWVYGICMASTGEMRSDFIAHTTIQPKLVNAGICSDGPKTGQKASSQICVAIYLLL